MVTLTVFENGKAIAQILACRFSKDELIAEYRAKGYKVGVTS